jgi:hypothetical protein
MVNSRVRDLDKMVAQQPMAGIETLPGTANGATLSPDEKEVVVSVGEEKSDVWLMDHFDAAGPKP